MFAASKKSRDLLVFGSGLEKAVVEIFGKKGEPVFHPSVIVGARILQSWRPITRADPESRGRWTVFPRGDQVLRVFNVCDRLIDKVFRPDGKPGADGIARLEALVGRFLRFGIPAAKGSFVSNRHFLERFGAGHGKP